MTFHFINLSRNSRLWLGSTVSGPAVLGSFLVLCSASGRPHLCPQAAWPPVSQHPPLSARSCLFTDHPLRADVILMALHAVGHPRLSIPVTETQFFYLRRRWENQEQAYWSLREKLNTTTCGMNGMIWAWGPQWKAFGQGHGGFWQSQRAPRFPSSPSATQCR